MATDNIRVLRIADKSREAALRLFTAEIFSRETEADKQDELARAIRAHWLRPESGTVTA